MYITSKWDSVFPPKGYSMYESISSHISTYQQKPNQSTIASRLDAEVQNATHTANSIRLALGEIHEDKLFNTYQHLPAWEPIRM